MPVPYADSYADIYAQMTIERERKSRTRIFRVWEGVSLPVPLPLALALCVCIAIDLVRDGFSSRALSPRNLVLFP
jgi:hypothetical protein